jgi:tetratricopeptide (TPR) repeat protein
MLGISNALRAIALIFVGSAALADTPMSAWQKLREPQAATEELLHLEARRALLRLGPDPQTPLTMIAPFRELHRRDTLELVLGRLERATQERAESRASLLQLRFDLGEVYEELGLHASAILAFRKALELAPNHPMSEDAWLGLAYAHAKSDEPGLEKDAYEHYLATAKNARSRTVATLNLAEAEMRLGNLREAIEGYRNAFDEASLSAYSQETAALAVWGLAVALDRVGDTRAAREEAERAVRLDKGMHLIGESDNVFFEPAYERYWYLGLGYFATARAASDPRDKLVASLRAVAVWQAYVSKAHDGDLWIARARKHLTEAEELVRRMRLDPQSTRYVSHEDTIQVLTPRP